MNDNHVQTKAELLKHWQEQLDFISRSSDAYDSGYVSEAKRIASALRVLFHHTGSSASLLHQLSMTDVKFYDSSVKPQPGVIFQTYAALTSMVMEPRSGAVVVPNLDSVGVPAEYIEFDGWWNGMVFFDNEGNLITRRMLVLGVSNKDGGAHVDPIVNGLYAGLSRSNSLKQLYIEDGKRYVVEGQELAATRQIGHEVLKTFVSGYARRRSDPVGSSPAFGNVGISFTPAKKRD